ncbi:MAG TPA: hypothetical protein PLA94_31515, partial [Myxococcota bacterium]|nr:hypothetical protein [Myxococcota bacterium]
LTDARGASLGMSGGILAGLEANGLYTWTRTSVDSAISETTLQITDALLHAAITEVLQKLQHVGWKVVVFYDDLDQASGTSDPDRAKEIIQKVLALSGCIALIHLRTEVMFDDVRREIDETLHLEPLSPTQLRDILAGRLQNAPVAAKTAFDQNNLGETLDRLAQQSLTPLVYLQTLHALLREHEQLPLPPDWHQPLPLARAIRRAISAGLEPQQLLDLAEVVDQNTTDRWFKLAYLESGNPVIHTTTKKIGKEALEQAKRLGLIYARDRYRSDSDYAMEPTLELLRPSRRAKLATA